MDRNGESKLPGFQKYIGMKNGAWEHLLLSLESLETLTMASPMLYSASMKKMDQFWLYFPFLIVLITKWPKCP